ncbi:MAG: hypothetical protein ACO1OK_09450, partial [Devosia sp.]
MGKLDPGLRRGDAVVVPRWRCRREAVAVYDFGDPRPSRRACGAPQDEDGDNPRFPKFQEGDMPKVLVSD